MNHLGPQGFAPREPRYAYDGKIRLLVPFKPWHLMLTLQGANISVSGLKARLEPVKISNKNAASTEAAQRRLADVQALLAEGDIYELQAEHETKNMAASFVRARLTRCERQGGQIELAFAFKKMDTDILELVHELAANSFEDRA